LRRVLALLCAALAAACAPPQAPDACDLVIEYPISFSAPGAEDRIVARSFGASCEHAVLLYAILAEDGRPAWVWAAPAPRAFGDSFAETDSDYMTAFLERWAAPRLERTAQTPAWPLPEGAATTLDQATYEDLRARDLPMLCHLTSVGMESCVFWEPAAGAADLYYERPAQTE
jgi:hypothetical protein